MTPATLTKIGFTAGWHDAETYAKGTKADRRTIRARVRKAHQRDNDLRDTYLRSFCERLEAFADAIREGRLPRTISPSKAYYVCNGNGMA